MFKSVTAKSITAVAAAALVSGMAIFLTFVVLEAKAETPVKSAVYERHTKGDALAARVKGATCSLRGWPYYEQGCQFDLRRLANDVRTVRVIAHR